MIPTVLQVASGREWRGGQNQVRLLALALAGQDAIQQVVLTGRDSELARRLEGRVELVTPTWNAALDVRALLSVIRQVRRRSGRPVILHAHDAHSLVLAGIAARITGVRLVVTRRVDFHLRRPGFWARADRVIAISDAVRRILLEDGLDPERVVVVHSGIDPAEVRAAPPCDLRPELGLAADAPVALNIAALVDHKDQGTLIAAAASIREAAPELHWVIAGEGPLRPLLEQRIREAGLSGRVHLVGRVENPWGLLARAQMFVMSSREEGLGTSVLDAMAAGLPIAATSAGGIPEMLSGGAGLLSPPGDGPALGASVLRLLRDPATRETVARAARETLPRFTARAMADGVLRVYRSVYPTG